MHRFTPLCLALLAAPIAPPPVDSAVSPAEVAATIRFLTAPELAGRAAAEPGGAVASAYVASRLEALGWLPCGDPGPDGARSWFQSVPALLASYDRGASRVERAGSGEGGVTIHDGPEPGFRTLPDRAESVDVSGSIVFAGFGIRAPEHGRDDYTGLDPRGKIVVVLSGEPGELDEKSPWSGARPTRHLPVSSKRALAASLGASALVVVPNPAGRAKSADDLRRGGGAEPSDVWIGLRGATAGIPVVFLDPQAAARLFPGLDLASASAALEQGQAASREIPGPPLRVQLAYTERREITLRNVLARLGAGRGLLGEIVVLGAHWDHLGSPGGVLHPGADDNASGIAGLLGAAAALKADPPRGERDVVLAGWTGEESGRLGSTYFTQSPPVPLARIAAAVNLDMLGRDNLDRKEFANVLQVIYAAQAPVLREIALAANGEPAYDLRFYPALRFRPVSDHAALLEASIPVVYPFSGYHDDYHRASDTPDKVSVERIVRAARYVARLARLLAEHAKPIRLDPAIREAPPPDPFPTPYGG